MSPSVASMVSTLYSLAGTHDTVLLRPSFPTLRAG